MSHFTERIYRWSPFDIRCPLTLAPGILPLHQFGRNPAVDVGATVGPQAIWEGLGEYIFPTEAQPLVAISTDGADDSPAGDGARVIRVWGLDANWDMQFEDIVMNGTGSTAATTTEFCRVNEVGVYQAGDDGTNVGIITVSQETSGIVVATVGPNVGHDTQAVFTVPNQRVALLTEFVFVMGMRLPPTVGGQGILCAKPNNPDDPTRNVTREVHTLAASTASPATGRRFKPGVAFAARTDIWINCEATAKNSVCFGGIGGYVADDHADAFTFARTASNDSGRENVYQFIVGD